MLRISIEFSLNFNGSIFTNPKDTQCTISQNPSYDEREVKIKQFEYPGIKYLKNFLCIIYHLLNMTNPMIK